MVQDFQNNVGTFCNLLHEVSLEQSITPFLFFCSNVNNSLALTPSFIPSKNIIIFLIKEHGEQIFGLTDLTFKKTHRLWIFVVN